MTPKEIEKWLDRKKDKYIALYGLAHWQINIEVDSDEDADCFGDVSMAVQYERATICLYASQLEDEQQLHETLCHELEHILQSPFDTYRNCVARYLPKAALAAMEELHTHCVELARSNVGRFRANFFSSPPD